MDSRRQKSEQMMKQNEERTVEEVRKLRNQRDELAAELEKQNKARLRFIANLAHELRTPLTPILGCARLLAEQFRPEPGSPQDRLIRGIINSAEALESRLSDLLDLAQLEAGVFSLEMGRVDLRVVINDLALQYQPLAQGKGQTLALDLPDRMPLVKGDRRRIVQILMNLLENAVKFTPRGGSILVRAMINNGDLAVEVHNTGLGLSPEEQQRLFRPYYRSEADRHGLSGSGLGLAVCKQLVEGHGGKLWVQSDAGKGVTFGFTLPLEGSAIKKQELHT